MSESGDHPHVLDRLFDALSAGDVPAACATLSSDAVVWHGFDRVARDRDTTAADWTSLVASFPRRRIIEVRRAPTPTGFVQQHIQVLEAPDGAVLAWPVCILVTVHGQLISRIDEYLDRAGFFTPAAAELS